MQQLDGPVAAQPFDAPRGGGRAPRNCRHRAAALHETCAREADVAAPWRRRGFMGYQCRSRWLFAALGRALWTSWWLRLHYVGLDSFKYIKLDRVDSLWLFVLTRFQVTVSAGVCPAPVRRCSVRVFMCGSSTVPPPTEPVQAARFRGSSTWTVVVYLSYRRCR